MKEKLTRKEAQNKIDLFFSKSKFSPEEVRKIKRLAMKFKISLKNERKLFCKKCFSKLDGKIRLTKNYKLVACTNCGYLNKQIIRKPLA